MRVLTILSGVLMAATGAFCLMNSGQTFMSMAFLVGAVMVFFGLVHSVAYLISRDFADKNDKNGWIFIDGLLTLLLGILILCNQLTVDIAVPMIFGMWMLAAGLLRIEAATRIEIRKDSLQESKKKRGRLKVVLITGIITAIIGLMGLINPFVTYFSVVPLLGFFLIMHGINSIELGINMPHSKKEEEIKIKPKKAGKPGRGIKIEDDIHETPEAVKARKKQKQGTGNKS